MIYKNYYILKLLILYDLPNKKNIYLVETTRIASGMYLF